GSLAVAERVHGAAAPRTSLSCTIRRPLRRTLFPYTTLFRSRTLTATWQTLAGCPCRYAGCWIRRTRHRGGRCCAATGPWKTRPRSEEHTSELQSRENLVCRLLLEKKKERRAHSLRAGGARST